jgi:hypothetical protein
MSLNQYRAARLAELEELKQENTPMKLTGKYCVIGTSAFGRTFVKTEDEAVEHAKGLIAKAHRKRQYCGHAPAAELLVVEIKKVVRLQDPPIEVADPVIEQPDPEPGT